MRDRRRALGWPRLPAATRPGPCAASGARPWIRSAARSAIAIVGAFVLPRGTVGITEASTTRRPSTPRTRSSVSTHAGAACWRPAGSRRPSRRCRPGGRASSRSPRIHSRRSASTADVRARRELRLGAAWLSGRAAANSRAIPMRLHQRIDVGECRTGTTGRWRACAAGRRCAAGSCPRLPTDTSVISTDSARLAGSAEAAVQEGHRQHVPLDVRRGQRRVGPAEPACLGDVGRHRAGVRQLPAGQVARAGLLPQAPRPRARSTSP